MTDEIDRSATRLSSALTVGAAFVSAGAGAINSSLALGPGVIGIVLLVLGLKHTDRGYVSIGVVALLGGTVLASLAEGGMVAVLVSAVGALLAWDYATAAISVGYQLGSGTETTRLEAVHAGASAAVGVVTAGVGYGVFRAIGGGQPITALVLLLLGGALLVIALR